MATRLAARSICQWRARVLTSRPPMPRAHALYEQGRARWPDLEVDLGRFVAWVDAHLGDDPDTERDGAGLYLACACADLDDRALRTFDDAMMPVARAAVARVNDSSDFVADVCQQLRHVLFVAAPGETARISAYSGRGSLEAWLRVVATRIAVPADRRSRREVGLPTRDTLLLGDEALDPAVALLRRRHGDAVIAAMRDAIAGLQPRQRTLLRFAFVNGMSGEEIARLYRVHRSSVSRWLAQARKDVLDAVRSRLRAELGATPSEIDSLLRAIETDLDVNLTSLLDSDPTGQPDDDA